MVRGSAVVEILKSNKVSIGSRVKTQSRENLYLYFVANI